MCGINLMKLQELANGRDVEMFGTSTSSWFVGRVCVR